MAEPVRVVYICMECHNVGEQATTCHPGRSRSCEIGEPGDERSRPLFDAQGNLITRAPRWWVEACFRSKKQEAKS